MIVLWSHLLAPARLSLAAEGSQCPRGAHTGIKLNGPLSTPGPQGHSHALGRLKPEDWGGGDMPVPTAWSRHGLPLCLLRPLRGLEPHVGAQEHPEWQAWEVAERAQEAARDGPVGMRQAQVVTQPCVHQTRQRISSLLQEAKVQVVLVLDRLGARQE